MRNIRVDLEYDGSGFYGFQRQPGRPTIQEAFEKALSRLFDHPHKICAASGRTDAGVHAREQVLNFKTFHPMPLAAIQRGLNALLPLSVVVTSVRQVPSGFHARYRVRSKQYEYCLWNHPLRSPLAGLRAYHVTPALDLSKMRSAASHLEGRHDFRSFSSERAFARKDKNTVRTIRRIRITRQGRRIRVAIEADGFLYHMVRNIVGMLVEVGLGKREPDCVKKILTARDRRKAGMTAPAHGLTLKKVMYRGASPQKT